MQGRPKTLRAKTLRETRNESSAALNFYAASFGKGPRFELDPMPTPSAKRKPQPGPESAVLSAVLKFLSIHPSVAWVRRMNTGSFQIGSGPSARWFKAGFKGCSDIIGQMKDGRFVAVEVKAERGRVSPEQQAFLDTVRLNGGVSGVVRSVGEAELLIKYALMKTEGNHADGA